MKGRTLPMHEKTKLIEVVTTLFVCPAALRLPQLPGIRRQLPFGRLAVAGYAYLSNNGLMTDNVMAI